MTLPRNAEAPPAGIPSWARVGAKVVCIGRKKKPGEPDVLFDRGYRMVPTRGEVYVIARTFVYEPYGGFLVLVGFPNDLAFPVDGFKPLITQEDDLKAHFAQYLKTDHRAPEKVFE